MTSPSWLRPVDDVLRQRTGRAIAACGVALVAAMFYGAVMGSYAGNAPPRVLMMLFAALKVPLLVVVSFALCLPSWYVLHALLGLRDDFPEALRAVLLSQATLAVTLASLAPLVALWYVSFADYQQALLFNGAMFAVASLAAQIALRRSYRPLIARRPAHVWTLRAWLIVYIFVGIQMAWVLRPFVGNPGSAVTLFRKDAWDNAYVFVARLVWDAVVR